MPNPDQLTAAKILAAAMADGALRFVRASVPEDEVASFLSFMARGIEEQLRRERLAAEQFERERLAEEQRERERRERERLALDQRSPICLPAVMPSVGRRPLRQRSFFAAARPSLVARDRCAVRTSRAARRSGPAPGFFENVDRELDKLGNPACMTPTELAEHLDRVIVAPISNLSPTEAATAIRASFHHPRARVPRATPPSSPRNRQRRSRHGRRRVNNRGPRAPASVDAPPEPPGGEQTAPPLGWHRAPEEIPRTHDTGARNHAAGDELAWPAIETPDSVLVPADEGP